MALVSIDHDTRTAPAPARETEQRLRFSAQHGSTELAAINLGLLAVLGLTTAAAIVPVVENAVTAFVIVGAGVAALGVLVRYAARWVRERAEDRADARYAALVRQDYRR